MKSENKSSPMKIAILDGYVDEPSCLGVPPYIAPYPRYIWGMLRAAGLNSCDLCTYLTIDQFRADPQMRAELANFDLMVIIAGAIVPGKYLGGVPLMKKELPQVAIASHNILVGPITLELAEEERDKLPMLEIIDSPFEDELYERILQIAHAKPPGAVAVAGAGDGAGADLNRFALLGADVVLHHPDFPHVICEMETYRGCYWSRCSFCIERFQHRWMRPPECLLSEFERLYSLGVRHFRLGKQSDFLCYMADLDNPIPEPERMLNFHRAIWRLCPGIKTLHLDNINPKTIAMYPEESREVLKTIVEFQTPGNVAAFGMESADERVVRANHLAAQPDEVLFAISMLNRLGRLRGANGMPYLLPGLNFVFGLKGETRETFELDYEFLQMLLQQDLLIRRINIRQVKILPHTPIASFGYKNLKRHKRYFKLFKRRVRENIDREMLRRIIPPGTVLRDLRCESRAGKITFARQMGSYPILVGIVGEHKRNEFVDAKVIDYGMRSITAIEYPLAINNARMYQIEAIPGIGARNAARIIRSRPFRSIEELSSATGEDIYSRLRDFIRVNP